MKSNATGFIGVYYFIIMGNILNRSSDFLLKMKEFRCKGRAGFANSRFNEKITKQDVCEVLFKYNFKCFYCNSDLNKNNWQLDHFHPKANKGLNVTDNLVCTCKWCNTMKNALDGNSFINKCHNIVENNFFIRNGVDVDLQNTDVNKKIRKIKKKFKKYNIDFNEKILEIIKNEINS